MKFKRFLILVGSIFLALCLFLGVFFYTQFSYVPLDLQEASVLAQKEKENLKATQYYTQRLEKEAQSQYVLHKWQLKQQMLPRYIQLKFWGICSVLSVCGIAGLIYIAGLHRAKVKQASVHTYRIGEYNEFAVHEKDLSIAAPIAMGLMNAEQLKQMNGGLERAFDLYTTMAQLTTKQISALTHQTPVILSESPDSQNGKIPTFQELLTHEEIAPGKSMILGYEHGVPRRGSFLDIYSSAIAGESGSGKTATLLFLIGSGLIAENVQYFGIDPHYPHPKSLGFKTRPLWEAGLMRMTTYYDDMLDVLKFIETTIDRRLKQIDTDTTPIVLVIDELAFLGKSSIGKDIAYTMERISTEGRKCKVYLLASSQTWIASRLGPDSTLRDTLTSAFVHRIKPKQANLLLQDKEETEKVKKYVKQPGEVLLCPVNDESVICQIPYTTEEDMQKVANMVSKSSHPLPTIPLPQKTPQRQNTEAREVNLSGGDIKLKREQKKLTQGDLIRLTKEYGCEISQPTLSRAENGKKAQWTDEEMAALKAVLLTNLVPLNTQRKPPDSEDMQ